jgi:hypothetical protein
MDDQEMTMEGVRGIAWRLAASLLIGVLWFAFLMVWLFFLSSDFSFYENLAVILLSGVAALGSLMALWLIYGLSLARQVRGIRPGWASEEGRWFGKIGVGSLVVWASWFGFLNIWLYFFADGYEAIENVAAIVASMIVAGVLSAGLWSRFRDEFHS